MLSQQLYVAAAADVAREAGYDPELDRRVEWLREVIRQVRCHEAPVASMALEQTVDWLLHGDVGREISWKEMAAKTHSD
jgi:hypothetical protein